MITLKELEAISVSRGDMPADKWEALLESCPEWVAQRDARELAMRNKEKRYLDEEAPLRDDLHRLGFPVKWVWDFVNSKENYYIGAIQTLIEHLRRPYSDEVREGIARSLAVKEARGVAGEAIIDVLNENGLSDQLRWALANTLAVVADRSNRASIVTLLAKEANKEIANRLSRALKTAIKP